MGLKSLFGLLWTASPLTRAERPRRGTRTRRRTIPLSFERLEDRRLLSAGALDPTFGSGGKVTTDFGGVLDQAASVVIQPDGKVVAAGVGGFVDFALARYNANGTLDPTFGSGGKVTTDF